MNNKLKRFEGFNNQCSKDVIEFLNDFQTGKFKRMISKISNGKKRGNNTHDIYLIINDARYSETYDFIKSLYESGYGIKSMIKDYHLPITYPVLRKLMTDIMLIKLRSYSEITDILRSKRREKVKSEHTQGTGWFSDNIIRKNGRGIQGYYTNKSNKKVWLRSTYEYIYALWLDENDYIWDVEYKSYRLDDGSLYKPDFFIFDDKGSLIKIVETKGYWKNRSYKFYKLQSQLSKEGIECEIITDDEILSYTKDKLKNITKLWKLQERK